MAATDRFSDSAAMHDHLIVGMDRHVRFKALKLM
jgi:hypothetical protein